jgi:hypothetical protein
MTAEQQQAWARVARAAATVGELYRAGGNSGEANRELFESTVDAVFARVQPSDVAEAMRAGWPELAPLQATDNLAGYLQRQADLDYSQLHWRLVDLQASATTNQDHEGR